MKSIKKPVAGPVKMPMKGPGNYVEAPGLRARDTDVMRKALGLNSGDRVTPQHAMSLMSHPDVNVQKAAKSFLSGVHGAM